MKAKPEPNLVAFEKMTHQLLALTIKHKDEMLTFREIVNQRMMKKKSKITPSKETQGNQRDQQSLDS